MIRFTSKSLSQAQAIGLSADSILAAIADEAFSTAILKESYRSLRLRGTEVYLTLEKDHEGNETIVLVNKCTSYFVRRWFPASGQVYIRLPQFQGRPCHTECIVRIDDEPLNF